ncbi:hypothetical protein [Streptomyces sp. NBC_00649]|uniref:hypothetical protein n=1 Tax=Streptomyces sp. NBC_00649 TaxID=2975798 RepID=UPI00324430DD
MRHTDWGTVPAWLSAILTGGSLLLGFYILLRDRRKEERQEALKITCWSEMADNDTYNLHVLNASNRPVTYARMLVYMKSHDAMEAMSVGSGAIRPGEEITAQCPRRMNDAKSWPAAVEFQNSDGINWVRDLHSGALYRRRGMEPSLPRLIFQRRGWAALTRRLSHRRQLLRG